MPIMCTSGLPVSCSPEPGSAESAVVLWTVFVLEPTMKASKLSGAWHVTDHHALRQITIHVTDHHALRQVTMHVTGLHICDRSPCT